MQESLDRSLVRLRTADGQVVGAGFLVGERAGPEYPWSRCTSPHNQQQFSSNRRQLW